MSKTTLLIYHPSLLLLPSSFLNGIHVMIQGENLDITTEPSYGGHSIGNP